MSAPAAIPFNDLSRTPAELANQIEAAISRVLSSGWYVMGPEHDALEKELASYVGVSHVLNVANGTEALQLGLAALGVKAGDYVVTVANAGAYTSIATRLLGAIPAYCDIDRDTHLMSAATLRSCLNDIDVQPAAIVVTHLYGALAPMEELVVVAAERGIPVLEDCAQSLGARMNGAMGGSLADIATTSFYPTKNLGAVGDAGAIFTNNDELATSVRRMRQYGWNGKYNIEFNGGHNSRLDELQAAVLRVKLPHLDAWNERRRHIHSRYEQEASSNITLVNHASERYVGHLAVATSDDRDGVRSVLAEAGIKTDVHYPIPDHEQKLPAPFVRAEVLSVTEELSQNIFSLPLFPELTDDEVERVCLALASL